MRRAFFVFHLTNYCFSRIITVLYNAVIIQLTGEFVKGKLKKPGAHAPGSVRGRYSALGRGRALMLRRLTARVDRLWSMAEAAGDSTPATPRPISAPLKPMTKR